MKNDDRYDKCRQACNDQTEKASKSRDKNEKECFGFDINYEKDDMCYIFLAPILSTDCRSKEEREHAAGT